MNDLRTGMERIGARIERRPDAFERLERAKRRRERIRRVQAGSVALLVATAGSLAAFAAFRDSEPRTGGTPDDSFFALWPEKTYEEAFAEQASVDEEFPGARVWRNDPVATAEEFARSALGWGWETPDADIVDTEVRDGEVAGSGPITVEIRTPPWPCPAPESPDCLATSALVTLARLVRPDGIWSVTEVGGDAFELGIGPGEPVEIGGSVAVATTLEETAGLAVGVKGTGACSGFHERFARVVGGQVEIAVEGVGEGCAGYVYALTPPTPEGQVELGKIMFAWGEPKPALGYTIESIAAVPVRFVAPSAEEPSIEPSAEEPLVVECGPSTIDVRGPPVAGPAGVHVVVENTIGDAAFLQVAPRSEGPWSGLAVPSGTAELAMQAPPGPMTVRCSDGDGSVSDAAEVDVLDPQGLFVPSTLACPGETPLEGGILIGPWQTADPVPEPIEFVSTHVDGLLPTDLVERAGYPEAADPEVRVVRDGAVVGSFGIHREFGEWALDGTWCSGLGISTSPGPDPYPRGWFQWCPEGPFSEPGQDWSERASEVTTQFVLAYVNGPAGVYRPLLDPSVPRDADFSTIVLAEDVVTVGATDAHGGQIVNHSCGNDVDAYTVAVTIDDGTESASADFTVFLVFRGADGWKVWGVY